MLSTFDLIFSWTALKGLKISEEFLRCTIWVAGSSVQRALRTVAFWISQAAMLGRLPANSFPIVKMPPPHQRDFSRFLLFRMPPPAPLIKLQPAFVVLAPAKCELSLLCLMPSTAATKLGSCALYLSLMSTKLSSPKSFLLKQSFNSPGVAALPSPRQ
ncbi:unnamed protein product [Trypanosoma congolense IL3000]|uniref:WGS project CAEQ00000000 data, annotated contig 1327 n=1 Tax=Trypanosoma congolense (strain IL3000) TaxID=1068625 RepID=F9W5H9_TRYCI|nr:unnamed protein product [Trypanosoma congolense IL3000]